MKDHITIEIPVEIHEVIKRSAQESNREIVHELALRILHSDKTIAFIIDLDHIIYRGSKAPAKTDPKPSTENSHDH